MKGFMYGRLLATPGALGALDEARIRALVTRHLSGDWGALDAEDRAANDRAVIAGDRILSAYPIDPAELCDGLGLNTVWIITEADRSVTTVLLPDEY
jgi:hypothetical protein